MFTTDDRLAVMHTIAMHGLLFDDGELERLDELFTSDVVYDVADFGLPSLKGIDAIRAAAINLGAGNALGHHVTNVVIISADDDEARTRCKAIAISADGTASTATYDDVLRRTSQGWRIARRIVQARREPLGGRSDIKR